MRPIAVIITFLFVVLQTTLIVMKLCGVHCSWWVVLTPIIAVLLVVSGMLLIIDYIDRG